MITLPSRKQIALIVHDMQNDYITPGGKFVEVHGVPPGTAEVIANHVRLLARARHYKMPVFGTGHFLRDDYTDVVHRALSPKYGALKAGTWGAEIIDELKPSPGEYLIRKGAGYSAFVGTPLEKLLRRLSVTTIIIGGISCFVGVESTVRDACDRDFDVVVASDACNDDPLHLQASLLNMAHFAQIATTSEVLAALDHAPDA